MGRKYGSIHFLTKGSPIDQRWLKQEYERIYPPLWKRPGVLGERVAQAQKALNLTSENDAEADVRLHAALSVLQEIMRDNSIRIRKRKNICSIYDDNLSFESIQDVGIRMSKIVPEYPVLYTTVFDDDIYRFGICSGGVFISEHLSGDCAEWGLQPSSLSPESVREYIGIELNAYDADADSGEYIESLLQKKYRIRFSDKD